MTWIDDFAYFLEPVDRALKPTCDSPRQLANYIDIHREGAFPALESAHVVIVGVGESRRSDLSGAGRAADAIRRKLYPMFFHGSETAMADVGNIAAGNTPEDSDHALKTVVAALLDHGITVLIIGGTQEMTFANYRAYETIDTTVNLTLIDSRPDMGEFREPVSPHNYLGKIVIHEPSYLFNVSLLGYQTYYTEPDMLEVLDKLFFDAHRLGEIASDIRRCEPLIRNADLVSVDMLSVRDEAAAGTGEPNGFTGEQMCALSRYAGISDKTTSFGVYNYDPDRDEHGRQATLIAQMVWYFMEGFSVRVREFPLLSKDRFLEYKVHMPDGQDEMIFYKSKRTDKWWMNVPYAGGTQGKLGRHHLVPCSYDDYQLAGRGEIPDMWWKTYRKLG